METLNKIDTAQKEEEKKITKEDQKEESPEKTEKIEEQENDEHEEKNVEDDPDQKDLSQNKSVTTTSSKAKINHFGKPKNLYNPNFYQNKLKGTSFTNDSSCNIDPLSSSRDSEEKKRKRSFDIEYPTLQRSHSTKKYHYSNKDYIIKEELHEEDIENSFCSVISGRTKYSCYTIMPKDNLYFLDKKKIFDENTIKTICTMEPVPETDDDNLTLQKPLIKLPSDRKEDSKLNVLPNKIVKKQPLNENEIIQEEKELDGIFDEYFDQRLDSIKIKYKSFYDKEEPPALFSGLEGEYKTFVDDIPDVVEELDFEDDAKEVIKKNSMIIQRKNKVADEIDIKKMNKSKLKFNSNLLNNEDKLPIDEKDELNDNGKEHEEKEEKDEKEEEHEDKEEEHEEKDSSDEVVGNK